MKTFRDIIRMDPLYKDSIQLLVDSGKQVRSKNISSYLSDTKSYVLDLNMQDEKKR